MQRFLLLACLGLCPAVALPAAQCKDPASTMLWEVQGGTETVYLLGSIHLGRADFYPLPAPIEAAYQTADFLVLEADIEAASDISFAMEVMRRGALPAGQTLDELLSEETLERLQDVLAEMGLPMEAFMKMQPWFLNVTLSSLQMLRYGYQPQYGVETYLLQQKPEAMALLELESIEEQLGFLESLNDEVYLLHTLEGFAADAESEMTALINAWRCANHQALAQALFAELQSDAVAPEQMDKFMEVMFYQRNRDMADTIASYIEDPAGVYFVTVGAGHLLGDGSIIELLQEKGYQVQAVRAD